MAKIDKTHQEKIFLDSIGQKATVQRETLPLANAQAPNRKLAELGLSFQEDERLKLKGYKYLGSAAVHIYAHEVLGQLDFVSQVQPLDLYGCPEILAAKAHADLQREMMALFNKRKGRLRSGF